MRPVPLVSGWNLLPFIQFLDGIGAPVARWLAESRISPELPDAPGRPVPMRHALDFAERAAREEGAESLGIDVGRQTAAECLGAFGSRLARCVTLYDRARTSCQLLSHMNNCETMWLERDGAHARLHARVDCDREPGSRHGEDFTLMLMLEAIGRAGGQGWVPDAIYLPGQRSQRFARDELFRGVSISYGAPNVTVVFPARLLSRPLKPLLASGGSGPRIAEGTCEDPDMPGDFIRSLRDTVASLLPLGCPTVHDLADITDLKPRTLQRRLAECGTSLRQVIDDARFGLAMEYLRDPGASVTDIALELGYGDSTAFTRAFHRLAGVPPTAYQEQRSNA